MAIVQISRITNRKGLAVDLPQPLAGAELGWVTDERRLFIGNGQLDEGAPALGNTEILTEYSDILSFAGQYTYTGQAATGYSVQTGPTPGEPVSQSLQARLDSYAVATDFGIVGDGLTDNTDAINRALYQLYCVDTNPTIRRSLFFPAGNYIITGTLLVPPYATLYGEGNNSSILNFQILPWTSSAPWQAGTLVQDGAKFYRSQLDVPVDTSIGDATYWLEEALPEYIIRTADSLQQIDVNITNNGAQAPQSIEIINLKLQTNAVQHGVLVQDASYITFRNVHVQGPFDSAEIVDFATNAVANAPDLILGYSYTITTLGTTDWNDVADTTGVVYIVGDEIVVEAAGTGTGTAALVSPNIKAVDWASTSSLVCNNVVFDNCKFSNFNLGTKTDQEINSCVISSSAFDTLYQGVYLGDAVVINGGALGVRILQNNFDNIYNSGIVFENTELNVSGYNVFLDVGNQLAGTGFESAPVIDMLANNNVSIGDMFERTQAIAESSGYARVAINGNIIIAFNGADSLQQGTYQRFTGTTQTLTDNTSNATLFTFDSNNVKALQFNYTITRGTATRTGVYTVVAGTDGAGTGLTDDNTGIQNSSTGVTFSAVESSYTVTVRYTTTSTGSGATIKYSITQLS